jgi:hypothetical protein
MRPEPREARGVAGPRPGKVQVSFASVRGATGYDVERTGTPDVEASWVRVEGKTRRRMLLEGLPRGAMTCVRVAGSDASTRGPCWRAVGMLAS